MSKHVFHDGYKLYNIYYPYLYITYITYCNINTNICFVLFKISRTNILNDKVVYNILL